MRPALGLRNPEMIAKSVVLPAPFGPISAVMRAAGAANDAASTARRPLKRRDTRSTERSGSATRRLRRLLARYPQPPRETLTGVDERADETGRREGNHNHQEPTIDHQIESRNVASPELCSF